MSVVQAQESRVIHNQIQTRQNFMGEHYQFLKYCHELAMSLLAQVFEQLYRKCLVSNLKQTYSLLLRRILEQKPKVFKNREISKLQFENTTARGRRGQNHFMLFCMGFLNISVFLIPFLLAAWELGNDGASLSPLKNQISKQDSFYPCSPKYLAGSSVKRAHWGILMLVFCKPEKVLNV